MALVTLLTAKAHCHVTDARQDVDVQRCLDHAEASILGYLADHPDVATWTGATVPLPVHQAILLHTAYFYRANRGDMPPEPDRDVWPEIARLLVRLRPLVVA